MSDLPLCTIEPRADSKKGRAFRALRVRAVMADALWEMGQSDKHERPVAASFLASDAEIRPFVANLFTGRPAILPSTSYSRRGNNTGYEFMRSAGYKVSYQRHDEGTVATLFLPDLIDRDPGMVDPKGVKFVIAPGAEYLAEESKKLDVAGIVAYARHLPVVRDLNEPARDWRGHVHSWWKPKMPDEVLADLVPLAYLHALYLSKRSRAPMPPDGKFYMGLLLACLKNGITSLPSKEHGGRDSFGVNDRYHFSEHGSGGYATGLACMADHEEVESVLASECAAYFERVEG